MIKAGTVATEWEWRLQKSENTVTLNNYCFSLVTIETAGVYHGKPTAPFLSSLKERNLLICLVTPVALPFIKRMFFTGLGQYPKFGP